MTGLPYRHVPPIAMNLHQDAQSGQRARADTAPSMARSKRRVCTGCVLRHLASVYCSEPALQMRAILHVIDVVFAEARRRIRVKHPRSLSLGQDRSMGTMKRVLAFTAATAWLLASQGAIWAQGEGDGPLEVAGIEAIRGNVVKVAGDTVSIKTMKGVLYKVATGANTRVIRDSQPSSASALKPGELVLAAGELDEKEHTLGAIFLAVVDAAQLQEFDQRRAEFGKTWLAGTVTSIEGTKVVIKRPDDVVTTVVADENTSFRKRHESITLGDVKVGDGLTARGTMQKGIFTGTLLTVIDAREIREWSKLRDR